MKLFNWNSYYVFLIDFNLSLDICKNQFIICCLDILKIS